MSILKPYVQELAHDHRLLPGCVNTTRISKTIAPPIEDNRKVLMQLSADLVADARDVDGLVLGNARSATEK
jgi:hypothetical protein